MIDFSKEQVVGVFAGRKPDVCHAIEVRQVVRRATGKTVVQYRESPPPANAFCVAQLGSPVQLVSIPTNSSDVLFERD